MAKDKSKKDGLKKSKKEKLPKGVKLLKGVAFNTFNPEAFRNQLVVAVIEGVGGQVMAHDSSDEANAADLADMAVTIAEATMKRLGYALPVTNTASDLFKSADDEDRRSE